MISAEIPLFGWAEEPDHSIGGLRMSVLIFAGAFALIVVVWAVIDVWLERMQVLVYPPILAGAFALIAIVLIATAALVTGG